MIKKIGIVCLVMLGGLSSCLKDKTIELVVADDSCPDTVSFQDELLPEIFNASCNSVIGCHSSTDAAAGFIWENYAQIEPHAERISNAINRNDGFAPMPLDRPRLDDSLIQKFDCWIEQGKLNN